METLNLIDWILERADRYATAKQHRHAVALLDRLSRFRDLSPERAADVSLRLGQLWLKRRRYHKARLHLRACLRHRDDSARAHYLLGLALHQDAEAPREKALRHYERALELAPRLIRCKCQAGRLLIDLGRTEEGLEMLRSAVAEQPAEASVVGPLVRGLAQAGRVSDALAAVRSALFLAPRCPRLRKLWIDLQLGRICQEQQTEAACNEDASEPVLLPFVQPESYSPTTHGTVRHDGAEALSGPHLVRLRVRG